jgi:outer membrane protein OmpA-like peptidoglycan-associated protein
VKIVSSSPPLPPNRSIVVSPFAEGSFALSAKLKSQIQHLAATVKSMHYTSVDLAGYTDNVFTPAFNATLDFNRAQAVAIQLGSDLATLKYTSVKINVVPGYSVVLVSTNATAQGRAANRRVVASLKAN